MAKIKSPLLMADGAKVRTIEELREHFDIASVLAYYDSGKLHEWLENYYYDVEAEKIGKLDSSSTDIKEKICSILGVAYVGEEAGNISLADVSDKNKRLGKLKKFTSDDEFLKAVDCVAFTQEELQRLLDTGTKRIYLCQEQGKFEIPDTEGVTYIGVNTPSANAPEWFGEKGIVLQNVDIGIEELLHSAGEYSANQDYAEAVKLWSKAAVFGNAEAQRELGRCYYAGNGVAQDYVEACKWYGKAAEQGDADAESALGLLYASGDGVAKDSGEAWKWYKKAAEHGNADTQHKIGDCYYYGNDVGQDYAEACRWYRKAAEQGYADAQYMLGTCYYNGKGVAQDHGEACKWYRKAAEQGDADARYMLDTYYAGGKGVAQDDDETCKQYRKAAEQGDAEAQYMLGICYYNGKGVVQDYGEACKWYRKAAEQGHAEAQNALGICYVNGEGIAKSYDEAYKWFRKAAEQGLAYAQYNLSECYENGYGVNQNFEEAEKWNQKAAEQGYEKAMRRRPRQKELELYVEQCKEFLRLVHRMPSSWNACNGELNSHKGRVQYVDFLNRLVDNLDANSLYGHIIYENMFNISAFTQTMFSRYKQLRITEIYMNGDPDYDITLKVNADISVMWNESETASRTLKEYFEEDICGMMSPERRKCFSVKWMENALCEDMYWAFQIFSIGCNEALGTYECLFNQFFDSLLKKLDGNDKMLNEAITISTQYPIVYDKEMENVFIWKYEDKGPYIEIEDGNQKYKYVTACVHLKNYETTTVLIHFCNMPLDNYTSRYCLEKNEYTEIDFTNFTSTTNSLAEVEWGNWVSKDVCELKITKNNDSSFGGELIIKITVDEVEGAVAVIKNI